MNLSELKPAKGSVRSNNRRGPGQGSDAFAPVFAALRRHGWDRTVAVEPFEAAWEGLSALPGLTRTYTRTGDLLTQVEPLLPETLAVPEPITEGEAVDGFVIRINTGGSGFTRFSRAANSSSLACRTEPPSAREATSGRSRKSVMSACPLVGAVVPAAVPGHRLAHRGARSRGPRRAGSSRRTASPGAGGAARSGRR